MDALRGFVRDDDVLCPLLTDKNNNHYPCQRRDCAMYRTQQKRCGLAAPFPVLTKPITLPSVIYRTVEVTLPEIDQDATQRVTWAIIDALESAGKREPW